MVRKLILIGTAMIAVATVTGVGYAAIPGADGTISACKNSKGALKVIDVEAGQSCPDGQQLLTWNQQGQPGPQGPAGPQGQPGSARGYAWVNPDGDVLEHRSLNVGDANVTKPAGTRGIYCITGLAFTPNVANVTPHYAPVGAGSGSGHPTPEIGFAQGCDDVVGQHMSVVLVDPSSGLATRDKGFFIVFN